MSCSNCFNGCQDIVSDKCVKYTGVDIPLLGILRGDSLSYVEQSIIGFLASTLDGTGIKPDMTTFDFCEVVTDGLPLCGDITILNIEQALSTAICTVNDLLTTLTTTVNDINSGYTVGCLNDEITDEAEIHDILQTLLTRFCTLETNFIALSENLDTTYVNLADLNSLIQAYLDSIASGDLMYNKMIPYSVVEYYGALSGFPTGADGFGVDGTGYGAWLNVYLCNGNNGTPDKRGRVSVGDTTAMGGAALDADRAAFPYTKGVAIAAGVNTITLSETQMPTHTHVATSTPTVDPHTHYTVADSTEVVLTNLTAIQQNSGGTAYDLSGTLTTANLGLTSPTTVSLTIATTNADAGSSVAHNNIQPGIGCLYIMYIP